jgi:hypothetical protein
MLYQLHIINYNSQQARSAATNISNKYYLMFFLDYLGIIRQLFKPFTQANKRFFNNYLVIFKD